jgi:hypothetical protein
MLQYRTGGLQNIEQDDGRILYEKTAKFWDTIEGLQNIGEDEDRILDRGTAEYRTYMYKGQKGGRQNIGQEDTKILYQKTAKCWTR